MIRNQLPLTKRRPTVQPLDPDSDAGRAAAEALTAFLASVEPKVARRRRQAVA